MIIGAIFKKQTKEKLYHRYGLIKYMNMKHFFTLLLILFLIGFVHASGENEADQSQAPGCVSGSCTDPSRQDTPNPAPLPVQEKIPINKTIPTVSQPETVLRTMSAPLPAANTMEATGSASDWDVAVMFGNVYVPNHFYPFSPDPGTLTIPYYAKFDTTDSLVRWIPVCSRCEQDPSDCSYWAGKDAARCSGLSIPCLDLDPFTTKCSCFDGIIKGVRMDGWVVERKRISDTVYEVHIAGQAEGRVYPYGELWLNPDSGWKFKNPDPCYVQADQTAPIRDVSCGLTSDTLLQFRAAGNCDGYCACEDSGGINIIVIAEKPPIPVPPIASFEAKITEGTVPLVVAFKDISTGSPTEWSWAFGDGGTSTVQNPEYTYKNAGTFSVSLTVTNADGTNTLTKPAFINAKQSGSPLDLIDKLIQYISSQNICKVPKKILVGQLEGAKKLLQNNRQGDAVLGMRGFVLSVNLFERSSLTREQAGTMRASADEIIAAINLPVNRQAVDMTRLLRADVNAMKLPALKQKILVLELDGTILMLECAKDKEAVDHLNIFIKTVRSWHRKDIPHDKAVHLTGEAADIIKTIGN